MSFYKSFIFLLILMVTQTAFSAQSAIARYAPFGYAGVAGLIQDWEFVRLQGTNPDVDSGTTPEDIWSVGGEYPFPPSAQVTTISSSSTDDDIGGIGCTSVLIKGLLTEWIPVSETVSTDGTTNVTLANQYFRINLLECMNSGSNQSNVGDIDVKHGATIIGRIPVGDGACQSTIFSVPANKSYFIDTTFVSILFPKSAVATLKIQTREASTNTWKTKITLGSISDGGTMTSLNPPDGRPLMISEKTDIRVRVTFVDTTDVEINANIGGFVVPSTFPSI